VKHLIVNADDLGLAPEVDRGIEAAAAAGAVTSVTLLVTTPGARAGAETARRLTASGRGGARVSGHAPVSVGLHVDLVTGRPAAPADAVAPLLGPDGGFLADAARRRAALDAPEAAPAIAAEVLAQVDRFRFLVGALPSHLDSHKHTHRDHPAVRAALVGVARALGLPLRAQDAATRAALRAEGVRTPDAFVGDVSAGPYWTADRLLGAITALGPGTTELMCHPGEPMGPLPGLFYTAQRATELAALTDARLPAALAAAGVRLVTFADVLA
jgi:predicted glycoside hydrolase/deacetylase ChbG (UPF0249 family)